MIGKQLGHYDILDKIGAGGMGEVYRARDTRLGRDVALKVLPQDMARDPVRLDRFEREAKVIAALNHPNIVTIHSVEEAGGVRFITMELVSGESLDHVASTRDLSLKSVFDIAIPLADALAAAHEKGIVHRDLKPANVMITSEGRVKVLDFGLAKLAQEAANAPADTAIATAAAPMTSEGTVLGTVPYMSPEQVRGQAVDHRSDIFSLGVILYELLVGSRPFQGETSSDLISSILRDAPQPVSERRDDLPPLMGRIIGRCLEKDRERRFQSAKDVRNELELLRREVESGVSVMSGLAVAESPPRRSKRAVLKFAVPSSVVLVAILLVLILKPFRVEISPEREALADDNALAIMYFDNLLDPNDPERLGEIATNLLIADLSESEYVSVVSSQRLYDVLKQLGLEGEKRIDRDVATQVATRAGAKWMLLGSILRTEPIVVTAQLVEVGGGRVVASQRIEGRPSDEIFDIVDQLTVEIKSDLSLPAEARDEEDPNVADVTSHSQEAYRYYLQGMEDFQKLLTPEGAENFRRAVEIDSTLAAAHLRLALTQFFPDRGTIDRDALDRAVRFSDGAGRLDRLYIRAFDQAYTGDHAGAVATFEEAIALFPKEKESFLFLGAIYSFFEYDSQRAIDAWNKVIELDPTYKLAHNYLAYEYDNIGDREASIRALDAYVQLVPDEPNPYDTMGDLYVGRGELDRGIEAYKAALDRKSDVAWTWRKLGALLLFKGDYDQAEKYFRLHANSKFPGERSFGRYYLAWVPAYRGRLDEALAAIDQAMAFDTMEQGRLTVASPHRAKALIYDAQGRLDLALSEMDAAMDARGDRLGTVFEHDWVYYLAKSGDLARAEKVAEDLKKRLQRDRPHRMHHYECALGHIAMAHGDFEAAIEHYSAAKRTSKPLTRDATPIQFWLARAYLAAGKRDLAVREYESILDRSPAISWVVIDMVKGHYELGTAYEASGWKDRAIESYERFLDIWKDADPGLEPIADARERLERLKRGS